MDTDRSPKANSFSDQEIPEEDLSAYNFRKFAATYFLKNNNPQYSKRPLKESLLDLPTPDDVMAAQAVYITILRFMGDMAEPNYDVAEKVNEPVMSKVQETLSRSFTNRKEYKVIFSFQSSFIKYHFYVSILIDR